MRLARVVQPPEHGPPAGVRRRPDDDSAPEVVGEEVRVVRVGVADRPQGEEPGGGEDPGGEVARGEDETPAAPERPGQRQGTVHQAPAEPGSPGVPVGDQHLPVVDLLAPRVLGRLPRVGAHVPRPDHPDAEQHPVEAVREDPSEHAPEAEIEEAVGQGEGATGRRRGGRATNVDYSGQAEAYRLKKDSVVAAAAAVAAAATTTAAAFVVVVVIVVVVTAAVSAIAIPQVCYFFNR